MRLIGYIEGTNHARTFGDYLYAQGVDNQIERAQGERYEVWIVSEDKVEVGKNHLISYQSNPTDPAYLESAEKAQKEKKESNKERKKERQH